MSEDGGLPTLSGMILQLSHRGKEFKISDLVLWRVEVSQSMEQKKLSPKWEALYLVDEVIKPKTYHLKQLDGIPLSQS